MMDKMKNIEKMVEILDETQDYVTGFCVFHESCEDCLARKYGENRCLTYLKAQSLVNKNVVQVVPCCCCSHYTEAEGENPLCVLHNIVVDPLGFCSNGERRDGNG